jgi:hypothetical protein
VNSLSRPLKAIVVSIAALASAVLPSAAESTVSFRAVCFDPSPAPPPEFHLASGESKAAARIPKNDIGGPFKATLRDESFVDFFVTAGDEKPAFSVKIPAEGRERLLLLIAPAGKGYQGSAVALPASGFADGATLAFNLCPAELAVRQGEAQPERLPAGGQRLLQLPANHKEDMLPVQILSKTADSRWQPVQSTRWAVDRRFRSYLFLFTTAKGKISLHAIPERLLEE